MPARRNSDEPDSDSEEPWRPLLDHFERILNNSVVKRAMGLMEDQPRVSPPHDSVSPTAPRRVLTSLMVEEDDVDTAFIMLLTQPGLESLQFQLEQLQKLIELWQQQGLEPQQIRSQLHVAIFSEDEEATIHFAKHYHAFLRACRVLPMNDALHRIDASSNKAADSIARMQNGMFLVSEAGKLSSSSDQDLATVMQYANTIVVAHYSDVKKADLPRVFEGLFRFRFDLTEVPLNNAVKAVLELMAAWAEKQYGGKVEFEDGLNGQHAEMFARRIAGKKGHNKAMRAYLTEELARVIDRQTARLLRERATGATANQFLISRSDLLGEAPDITAFQSKPWQDLQAMVGLEEVKRSLESFLNGLLVDYHRELQGQKPLRSGLSKLFVGPPGTGKTTVARLYGQILGTFGLLSSGELIVRNASEFIGRYIGHSEKRTRDIIAEARGKVLMIDEAYMLDPFQSRSDDHGDPFRQGVIDTIVGEIQNSPGEDICVILCGYKDLLERMIRRANPGLSRRFPMADAFVFEEFQEAQLEAVLDYKMRAEGFTMTAAAKKLAIEGLRNAKQQPNFGNGGEVTNLIGRALGNYRTRFGSMSLEQRSAATCFEAVDIDPNYREVLSVEDQVEHAFDHYVGVDHLKTQFRSLARRANALRQAGRDPIPFMPFHLVLKGPAGTGKTATARKMGWLYKSMKLLPTDEVVEITVRDMVADSYTMERSKVMQQMRKALGKVLFIDDAQRLAGSGNDQVDTLLQDVRESLIDAYNKPEFQGKVLVILAGTDKVDVLLRAHTQFATRFRTRLQFYTLSTTQCMELLDRRLRDEGCQFTFTEAQRDEIKDVFSILRRASEWANGRDIDAITHDLIGDAYENGACDHHSPVITSNDVLSCLRARIPQRLRRPEAPPAQPVASTELFEGEQFPPIFNGDLTQIVEPIKTGIARAETQQSETWYDAASIKAAEETSTVKVADEVVDSTDHTTPVTRGKYSYAELPIGRYTRVAILQPAKSQHQPMQIKLEPMLLEADPNAQRPFDALSYVWGNGQRTELISCDGCEMLVTESCFSAMLHLRNRNSPRVVWIDAICIDQSSLTERNHQVSLMGEIYQAASHVLIWLGPGSEEIDSATVNMQRLSGLEDDWGEHELVRMILFRKYKGDVGNVAGLEHIMRHDWWRRMWTFQEFVLAERPTVVVGTNKILWDDLVQAANNTFFSEDARNEMVRRKRQHVKANELVINNIMPPDEAENIRGIETSIHLVPIWKDIMDAHKGRMAYKLGFQNLDRNAVASDFLLKARMRQSKDPRDKLYGLYHILRACYYRLPRIDYSQAIERIYADVTLSIVTQSKSWWILSHLLRGRDTSLLELPSWVPDFCSQLQWHQRAVFSAGAARSRRSEPQSIQWPHNQFFLERLVDGGISTSGVFLWTVASVTTTLSPTPALDKTFEELFEESRYEVLLSTSEDFLFTMADWLSIMTDPDRIQPGFANGLASQDQDWSRQALKAIARTFLRAASAIGQLFGLPMGMGDMLTEGSMAEKEFHKMLSAIQPCMSPSPSHPCLTCGTSSAHESDDAMQHFIQATTNQATWLHYIVYMFYGCAVNRSMFRTNALDGCPGHFGFCGGQPRPGDEIVLLPGAHEPVILRRRPSSNGADHYRIVGLASGMTGQAAPHNGLNDMEAFCVQACCILDDKNPASRYKPSCFYLL